MFALGGLFLIFLIVGMCVLAAKVLFALALIPFKIGFGIVKLLVIMLIGIPVFILGATLAIAAIPILLVVGLVAAPFVLACKCFF